MLSPAIARELRERGHDVLAITEHPGWAALSDPEVLAVARTERRAVVTNNLRDYRPLHADAITPGGPGHFGMVSDLRRGLCVGVKPGSPSGRPAGRSR
jgi:uncharacterized protein YbjT (DUF2867 family)